MLSVPTMRTDSISSWTNAGLRKLLMIPIMNPSMNDSYYSESGLLTSAPSAATMRADSRSSGTNVGLRKLLMIPITNLSMNNSFTLKVFY